METVFIPCLRRLGNNRKHRIIQLDGVDKISVGRSANDADVWVASNMISRKHATFAKNVDGDWCVQDHNSLNGVYINDKRIDTGMLCQLEDMDVVRLGVPADGKEAEFVWQFRKSAKVMRDPVKHRQAVAKINSRLRNLPQSDSQKSQENSSHDSQNSNKEELDKENTENCSQESSKEVSQQGLESNMAPQSREEKRGRVLSDAEDAKPGTSTSSPSAKPPLKRLRPAGSPLVSPSAEVLRKLEEAEKEANRKRAEHEARLAEMEAKLKEEEDKYKQREEELKKKEEDMKKQLAKQKEEMEQKYNEYQQQLQEQYQQQLQEREAKLQEQLQQDHSRLVSERAEVERKLQEELSAKLGEKDKQLEQELRTQKERLDKVIEQKECEQKMLQGQLDEALNSCHQQKDLTALKTKEQIITIFSEILETELQCSICNELFVQAMTLNCAHSFCALCLEQWVKVKKECPVCRAAITSIVLDSYIDKMCEHLNEDMKEARVKLVQERKEEMRKLTKAKSVPVAPAPAARGRARGRGRGRGRARNTTRRGAGQNNAANAIVVIDDDEAIEVQAAGPPTNLNDNVAANVEVIDSGSDSEADSLNSFIVSDDEGRWSESGSSVEGDPGAYYGGYGACYRCGRRGHWANGCPYY